MMSVEEKDAEGRPISLLHVGADPAGHIVLWIPDRTGHGLFSLGVHVSNAQQICVLILELIRDRASRDGFHLGPPVVLEKGPD